MMISDSTIVKHLVRNVGTWGVCLAAISLCVVQAANLYGHDLPAAAKPSLLNQVDLNPRLNAAIPMNLSFRDENGEAASLSEYAGGKPLILELVYYKCPLLCDRVTEGVATGLRSLSLRPGYDFNVVAVSINPNETPQDAMDKRQEALALYRHPNADSGWHFLTGQQSSIAALTKAAGFRYAYDPDTKTYVHGSGILILTPEGRISRYLYGIAYTALDLKLALLDASSGKIGTVSDHLLLFCYQYNPANGKYGAAIAKLLYWAGIATAITLCASIVLLCWREKRTGPRPRTTEGVI